MTIFETAREEGAEKYAPGQGERISQWTPHSLNLPTAAPTTLQKV